jgi:hypothetical protein
MDTKSMKRILVVGTSGSGKTAVAKTLSMRLDLPFVGTDDWYWGAGWRSISSEVVEEKVEKVVERDAWVMDGNFDVSHELLWPRADCIVWLDYPLTTILARVAKRNLRWWIIREPVWNGNMMNLRRAFSGIRHSLLSYSAKRKLYPDWLAQLSTGKTVRLRNQVETDAWVESLVTSRKQPS